MTRIGSLSLTLVLHGVAFFLVLSLGRFLFFLVCHCSHILSSPIPHLNVCDQLCLAPPHCVDALL
jgi:hypothetical protein